MHDFSKLPQVDSEHSIHLERYKKFIGSRPEREFKYKSGLVRHHIWPRSMGADSSIYTQKWNIISLTYREHYIAHLILYKCYGGKMTEAFFQMNNLKSYNKNFLTARQFERLNTERSLIVSERFSGENHPLYGVKRSEESKLQQSEKMKEYYKTHDSPNKGKKYSEERCKKMSEYMTGKYQGENNPCFGRKASEETRKKISEAKKGTKMKNSRSQESRERTSKALKGKYVGENNKRTGQHQTEETKQKISEAHKGKIHSKESIEKIKNAIIANGSLKGEKNPACHKVQCIETGIIYAYVRLAAIEVYGDKKHYQGIYRAIKNNKAYKNFTWQYID